jgi:hypothetical protein
LLINYMLYGIKLENNLRVLDQFCVTFCVFVQSILRNTRKLR